MQSGLLLNVVIGKGAAVLKLLSSKDKTLLIRWDSFLVLDLGLDILNGVSWLNLKGDGLAGEGLYENLCDTNGQDNQAQKLVTRRCKCNKDG